MPTQSITALLGPLPAIWLAALGLVVGSFLNVVIARVPNDESIVRPRSRCPKCRHLITWYENIPVLSYLALRGRCRWCGSPISARYPLIEVLTALLFLACLHRFGLDYSLAPALMLVTLLLPLTFIDAEHWILPHSITMPGIAIGVLMSIPMGADRVVASAIGAVAGFLIFRAMEFFGWLAFKKEAMGAGDKFLMALLGAFLSYQALLGIILLASLQATLFGVVRLLFTGRAGPAPASGSPAQTPSGEAPDSPAQATSDGPPRAPAQAPSEPPGAPAQTPSADPPGADQPQAPAAASELTELAEPKMSWAFLAPGLSFGRRLWLLPYSVFLQPIPDDPVDVAGEEVEWTPGATNLPFGPWLALGGLQLMLLGSWIADRLPVRNVGWLFLGQG